MLTKRLWLIVATCFALAFTASAYAEASSIPHDSSTLPTVNLVAPTHGTINGNTKVAIIGSNLDSAIAVDFGSSGATSFTVDSPTSLTAVSPPGTGTVDITVTTPDGTSQSSSADQFTYVAQPPVVDAISPGTGPITGGTKVRIIGQELSEASAVDFGSTPAASFQQQGGEVITAVAPPGTGTVDITVTTPSGTSQTTPADQFTYVAHLPSVHLVTPSRGANAGGTSVTVLGHNYSDVNAVDFGSTPAASFNVNSNHQITAIAPPGNGSVDITVTTNQGTSVVNSQDQFTYGFPPPSVSFVLPTTGGALGGTRVTIVGTGFAGASAVDFGSIPATRFRVNSDESITATAPAGTGTVDITVTTPQGTSATGPSDQFTYVVHPPVVRIVLPNSGSAGGGTVVTIIGGNFKDVSAVSFGNTPATSFEFDSNQALTATSPAGSGTVDITVTTPQGTSAVSSADQFTYG